MLPIIYNVRSLGTRKTTTAATVLGIGLVVFVFASTLMLKEGIKRALGTTGRRDNAIVISKGSDAELSSNIESGLEKQAIAKAGVLKQANGDGFSTAETVTVIALDKLGTNGIANITIRGVSANVWEFRPEAKIVAGRAAKPGSDEVVIGKSIRGRFRGIELGQSFEMKKQRPVKVVGVFTANGSSFESEVWADLETVRTAFGRTGVLSSLRVRLKSPEAFDEFKSDMTRDKDLALDVMRETEYYEKMSEGTSVFMTFLGVFISIFFSLGAMIGAAITMYSSVANRQREIGTLRAMGFSRLGIMFSFVLEAAMVALIGGAVGAVASLAMGFVKFGMVNFQTWSEIVFTFRPTAGTILSAMIFSVVMGLVGGLFPAIKAARMSPLAAMRGE